MKRILTVFLLICLSLSICGCLEVEPLEPLVSSAPDELAAPEETVKPSFTPSTQDSIFVGKWEIARDMNEHAAMLEYFGSAYRDYGAEMELGAGGEFSFFIGASAGGIGVWSNNADTINADYVSYIDDKPEELVLNAHQVGSTLCLDMNIGDFTIVWSKVKEEKIPSGEELYAEVLDAYYTAIVEGWDMQKLEENDMTYIVFFCKSYPDPLEAFGYYLQDINGDEYPELFLGMINEYGNVIHAMYTIDPATMQIILLGLGGERYHYNLNNDADMIAYYGSGGASVSYWKFYHLEGTELVEFENITLDGFDNPNNPWTQNGMTISEANARSVIDNYERNYMIMPFTPLADLH